MAEERSAPRVFTIPAGAPFLDVLAEALLTGRLVDFDRDDPLALAGVTILLPTRRAARAFRDCLLRHLPGEAAILPTIRTIGDVDEEEHLLAPSAEPAALRLALPAAVSPLDRRLALTQMTLAWGRAVRRELLRLGPDEPLLVPASAADAARLAGDLARLLDDMETAGIPWDRLAGLVPENHAGYFQITLDFLKIVAEQWPAHLMEIDRVDPAERRDLLIRQSAKRLAGPVIAAGSTGSIPATAELLKAIAHRADGAVVLPGLDQDMDEAGWAAIGTEKTAEASAFGHPQFGLKHLIGEIGILREDVLALVDSGDGMAARRRLVGEAMRPAETTDRWASAAAPDAEPALHDVELLTARNEQEEATAIALAIREAVETPGATVALVTPDRTIARRVAVELGRWGLTVDDSAGAPLDRLPVGVFARLVAEAALSDADPVTILALAKHPLAAFGMRRPACRRAARMLELALFRGHRRHAAAWPGCRRRWRRRGRHGDEDGGHRTGGPPHGRRRLARGRGLARHLADCSRPLERAFTGRREIPVAAAATLLPRRWSRAADRRHRRGRARPGVGSGARRPARGPDGRRRGAAPAAGRVSRSSCAS